MTRRATPAALTDLTERILAAHGARAERVADGLLRVEAHAGTPGAVYFATDRAALRTEPSAHLVVPGSPGFGRIVALARALPGRVASVRWTGESAPSDADALAHLRAHRWRTASPTLRWTSRDATVLVHHVRTIVSGERLEQDIAVCAYDTSLARVLDPTEVPADDDPRCVDEPLRVPSRAELRRASESVRHAIEARLRRTVARAVRERAAASQRSLAGLHAFYTDRLREEAQRTSEDGTARTRRLKEEWERKSRETLRASVETSIDLIALAVWSVPRAHVTAREGDVTISALWDHATRLWIRLRCARCAGSIPVAVVAGRERLCARCAGIRHADRPRDRVTRSRTKRA